MNFTVLLLTLLLIFIRALLQRINFTKQSAFFIFSRASKFFLCFLSVLDAFYFFGGGVYLPIYSSDKMKINMSKSILGISIILLKKGSMHISLFSPFPFRPNQGPLYRNYTYILYVFIMYSLFKTM